MELTRAARHIISSECGYFILLDELESELEHTYTWRIHSEKFATKVDEGRFEIVNGNGALNIFPISPVKRKSKIEETLVEEIMTPQRPDDIRRISLKTLLIENTSASKNTYFLNVLQPKDAVGSDEADAISVEQIDVEGCIAAKICSKEFTETFIYSSEGRIHFEGNRFYANWVSIVKDKAGNTVKSTCYSRK